MNDLGKFGRQLVQALRIYQAQHWTNTIREFKQTVGAAEMAKDDYIKCESDLDVLANLVSVVGFKVDETSVEKIESILGVFARSAPTWVPTLMKGSVDDMIKTVARSADDVFYDLDTADVPLKLRVLNTLSSCPPVLRCDSMAQKICYAQLSLQSQEISDRIVDSVGALKLGVQVG